jgi:hypothetical protein
LYLVETLQHCLCCIYNLWFNEQRLCLYVSQNRLSSYSYHLCLGEIENTMHFQWDFPVATSVWNSLVKPWYRQIFSWYSWKFRNQRIFAADFMVHICPLNTMKSLASSKYKAHLWLEMADLVAKSSKWVGLDVNILHGSGWSLMLMAVTREILGALEQLDSFKTVTSF